MSEALRMLDALLQGAAAGPQLFPPNSRYHGVATSRIVAADGRVVTFLARRFVPAPEQLSVIRLHTVVQADRLDNLAQKYFSDPLLFWRLCDADRALRPDELIENPGRVLRVTLPHGVPTSSGM